MSSRNNNLLLGAIAGASFALGYWLNSNKGREFRKDAQDTVSEAYTKGQQSAMDAVEKTSEVINEVIDTGVDMMKKAKESAMQAQNNVKQKVSSKS